MFDLRLTLLPLLLLSLTAAAPAQAGEITGHVLGADGQPVAAASVQALAVPDSTARFETRTDTEGRYALQNLPGGTYLLVVRADGFAVATADSVTVPADGLRSDVDFVLTPGDPNGGFDHLEGLVLDAGSGTPIPYARLSFEGLRMELFATTGTDETGAYGIGLVAQPYRVTVEALGYETQVEEVVFEGDPDIDQRNFTLARTFSDFATLSGSVRSAGEDEPIAGARVQLTFNGGDELLGRFYETLTDADGGFTLEGIVPTTYMLQIHAEGFRPHVSDVSLRDSEASLAVYHLGAHPQPTGQATVEGVVRDAATDTPIANAWVQFRGEAVLQPDPSGGTDTLAQSYVARTDARGFYRLDGIAAGIPYTVQAGAQRYDTHVILDVTLEPDETRTLDFALAPQPFGTVSGRVGFDGSGAPVPGLLVLFLPVERGGNARARTEADGTYTANVAPGDYYVMVHSSGADSSYLYFEYYDDVPSLAEATPITVADGENVTGLDFGIPDFSAPIAVTVSGSVVDVAGAPLAGAVVTATNFHSYGPSYTAHTDADGRYTVTLDRYYQRLLVSAEKEGYATRFYRDKPAAHLANEVTIDFNAPETDGIDFVLEALVETGSAVRGQVANAQGMPLGGALVIGIGATSGQVQYAHTDADGRYRLDRFGEEDLFVLAAANGYAPAFHDGTRFWAETTPISTMNGIASVNVVLEALHRTAGPSVLTGRALLDDARPAEGVLVMAQNEAGAFVAYDFTDTHGTYRLEGLGAGTYTLHADKVHFQHTSADIQVGGAEASELFFDVWLGAATHTATEDPTTLPDDFRLEAAYPNPFNPATTLQYVLGQAGPVRLQVFDVLGREVALLADGPRPAGTHTVRFEAGDLPSGLYFYRLTVAGRHETRTMVLTK